MEWDRVYAKVWSGFHGERLVSKDLTTRSPREASGKAISGFRTWGLGQA